MKNTKNITESRRNFLKKAAYAAPAIMVLGTLTVPTSAHASYIYRAQVNNVPKNRQADLYQQNDGTKWVKSIEDDSYVTETLIHKTRSNFVSWIVSFFS